MKTISSAVEDYIKSKPFLISALSQGIINLTSLSRIIKSEIEESLRKEVKYGAIVMALKSCLLYTSPSPRDKRQARMPSSA